MEVSLKDRVIQAAEKIKQYVRRTPIDYSPWLSEEGNAKVYIKWESEQITGSFKARGAFNKLLIAKEKGITGAVTASSGNHGVACAHAMKTLGINGVVYVPEIIQDVKRKAIEHYGTEVKLIGQDCVEAEVKARAVAEEAGATYIPPYSDLDGVAGQGTIGVEIYEDLPSVDVVFLSVGGGGFAAGIAGYLKAVKPTVEVIGCQPEQSPVMWESIKAGHIIDMPCGRTLSDGTAGGIEQGTVTFDLCRSLINDWVLVTEEEIGKAVYDVMDKHHKIVEGAAGLAFAAYLKTKQRHEGKTVMIVSCGANIGMDTIKDIIKLHG